MFVRWNILFKKEFSFIASASLILYRIFYSMKYASLFFRQLYAKK
jgi:hypothetical protein